MFGISVDIRKLDPVIAYLKSLPRGAVKVALPAMAEWFIGNGQRGLKQYPAYKHITRKRAYGKTFVSDKQRRYVMAMIREGRIDPGVPHRTGNTQRAYTMSVTNRGYTVKIVNRRKGAVYTRHNTMQARLNLLAGWRKSADVIKANTAGAIRHARAKVREYLRKKGK
jgi:hypothetical protein